jgi:hypothetical protein
MKYRAQTIVPVVEAFISLRKTVKNFEFNTRAISQCTEKLMLYFGTLFQLQVILIALHSSTYDLTIFL